MFIYRQLYTREYVRTLVVTMMSSCVVNLLWGMNFVTYFTTSGSLRESKKMWREYFISIFPISISGIAFIRSRIIITLDIELNKLIIYTSYFRVSSSLQWSLINRVLLRCPDCVYCRTNKLLSVCILGE